MRTDTPVLFVLVLCSRLALALAVQDVVFQQARDGSKMLQVSYTLVGDSADVGLYLSSDAGVTYEHIRQGVTGDRGPGTAPGARSMLLDLASLDSISTDSVVLKVSAFRWPGGIRVPAHTFTMGCDTLDVASPVRSVTLTNDYYVGRYPVTFEEYRTALQWAWDNTTDLGFDDFENYVVGYNANLVYIVPPSILDYEDGTFSILPYPIGEYAGQSSAEHPMVTLTWFGAAAYCDWLSRIEGLEPFYNGDYNHNLQHNPYAAEGYRLLTEAEWESAARYPDDRTFPWGEQMPDCTMLNFNDCIGGSSPVGTFPDYSSDLGLMDLSGQVFEWIGDNYASGYNPSETINPLGPQWTGTKVRRGGSFQSTVSGTTVYNRWSFPPSYAHGNRGFRICRTAN